MVRVAGAVTVFVDHAPAGPARASTAEGRAQQARADRINHVRTAAGGLDTLVGTTHLATGQTVSDRHDGHAGTQNKNNPASDIHNRRTASLLPAKHAERATGIEPA
jgi:hypothetical protein